jgi:hypothetical protein
VTVVRDTAPQPITVTATTPLGVAAGTFELVELLSVVAEGRDLTVTSDDGLTWVGSFVA